MPWEKTGLGFDGWPKLLERADSGFGTGKALRTVVSILEYLEQSSPVSLALATKLLADGSRYGKLLINLLAVAMTCTGAPD